MYNFKILAACIFSVLWASVLQAEQEPLPITSDLESISFNSIEGPVTIRRFANDILSVSYTHLTLPTILLV